MGGLGGQKNWRMDFKKVSQSFKDYLGFPFYKMPSTIPCRKKVSINELWNAFVVIYKC